ncbi:MAG: hypothetical protein C0444_00420 [Microbacterium sp.]|nr:hypothetical protein [Microbacterium sp.]MBA4346850.1 hypothetical protein [Microbacterium sp.]
MTDGGDPSPASSSLARHGRELGTIAIVSIVGIIATAGFQIVAVRGLGPADFGLLAALLAVINIVAIGSGALRTSVAVNAARATLAPAGQPGGATRDTALTESLILGGASTLTVVVLAPWLLIALDSTPLALAITTAALLPYFLFARAQGVLQGLGRTRAVVYWTTGSQVLQLALTVAVVMLGFGVTGVLIAVLATVILGTFGSSMQARRLSTPTSRRAFDRDTTVVLLLTIAFAVVTNVDVILVRALASTTEAGAYAAAAVLVKTTLIIPATLSLYLLPRFVVHSDDRARSRRGLTLTLLVTLGGGILVALALALIAGPIIELLFGGEYSLAISYLPLLAISFVPWAVAQAVLIRTTAVASRFGLVVVIVVAVAQGIAGVALLPTVEHYIIANGLLGSAAAIVLLLDARRDSAALRSEQRRSA